MSSRSKQWSGLFAMLWAVPTVFALQYAGGGGVPSAEGCSGGIPGYWDTVEVPGATGRERVEIATDGFVVLKGSLLPRDFDSEEPVITVHVTGEDGEVVPGLARVLRADELGHTFEVYFGWQADQPLAVGTLLQLSWHLPDMEVNAGGMGGGAPADSVAEGSVELEVVGEPPPPPVPIASVQEWVDFRHGVGPLVECESEYTCGTSILQVPIRETRLVAAQVSWARPATTGFVAWEVWAEPEAAESGFVWPPGVRPRVVTGNDASTDAVDAGLVAFTDDASDHCVVIVLKDLRTGQESRSEALCEPPGQPAFTVSDHELRDCEAPPTADSLGLWCENRLGADQCAGVGDGSAGEANGGRSGAGPTGHDGGDYAAEDQPVARRVSPSGGCHFAPTRANPPWAMGILFALGALLVGGRRARRPARGQGCARSRSPRPYFRGR